MRLTSSQVYLLEPLNIMCSRKWETPLTDGASSRRAGLDEQAQRAKECESGFDLGDDVQAVGKLCW